jgi:hypothetical protein
MLRMFHFLQYDDIGIVAEYFGDGQIKVDRRMIGIGFIPCLAELHIEL